jgi:hypothetical protein
MAITPRKTAPPYATAGTGYAGTYLKKKAELLQEKKKWAQEEILLKYKSDLGYRTELKQMYEDIEKEQSALRKEREQFTLKSKDIQIKARKAAGLSGDDRAKLIAERQKTAEALARVGVDISGQRVDMITKAEGLFSPAAGALDQVTKATAAEATKFAVPQGRDTETAIDDFILRNPNIPTAFTGVTDEQKQSLAIHLYQETASAVRAGHGGQPLSATDEKRIKDNIATRFTVPVNKIDTKALTLAKQVKTDEYIRKVGTDTAALKKTIQIIDAELAKSNPKNLTADEKIADSLANSGVGDALNTILINSLRNDGNITADESRMADEIIAAAIARETEPKVDAKGVAIIPPNADDVARVLKAEYGLGVLPDKSALESYLYTNVDNPIIQTYQREGILEVRKGGLAGPLPAAVGVPTAEGVARRTAEIYNPLRSRRGTMEELGAAVSPENATRRRAMEQGIPLSAEELTGRGVGSLSAPIPMRGGTVGRQAPAVPQTTKRYGKADEMFEYMKAVQAAASQGKVEKRSLVDISQQAYDKVMSGIKDGSIKPENIYEQVSSITTSNQDIISVYGSPDLARKAKEDILYNIVASQYEQFLVDAPKRPVTTGVDLNEVSTPDVIIEADGNMEPVLPSGSVGVGTSR